MSVPVVAPRCVTSSETYHSLVLYNTVLEIFIHGCPLHDPWPHLRPNVHLLVISCGTVEALFLQGIQTINRCARAWTHSSINVTTCGSPLHASPTGGHQARMGLASHLTCEGGARKSTGERVRSSKMRRPFRFVRTFKQPGDQSKSLVRPPVLRAVDQMRGAGSAPECMAVQTSAGSSS